MELYSRLCEKGFALLNVSNMLLIGSATYFSFSTCICSIAFFSSFHSIVSKYCGSSNENVTIGETTYNVNTKTKHTTADNAFFENKHEIVVNNVVNENTIDRNPTKDMKTM